MSQLATQPSSVPVESDDMLVIARTPQEMQEAKDKMAGFFLARLQQANTELEQAEQALADAKARKWATGPFRNCVTMASKMAIFYEKIYHAADAGYCIVPNFPITVLAVRTEITGPTQGCVDHRWEIEREDAQLLPKGDGEYISPDVKVRSAPKHEWDAAKNQYVTKEGYKPFALKDPEFPIRFAPIRLLDDASRAMAGKFFDQIGVIPGKKRPDPMLIGRILDPRGKAVDHRNDSRMVSFLIAWWLDPRSI